MDWEKASLWILVGIFLVIVFLWLGLPSQYGNPASVPVDIPVVCDSYGC